MRILLSWLRDCSAAASSRLSSALSAESTLVHSGPNLSAGIRPESPMRRSFMASPRSAEPSPAIPDIFRRHTVFAGGNGRVGQAPDVLSVVGARL